MKRRIIAVARFSNPELPKELAPQGIETIACDLLEPGALERLPEAPNVIFMAARKFGSSGAEHLTWAMNTYLPVWLPSVIAIRASSRSPPVTCIRCARPRKAAPRKPRPSDRSANTRNRRSDGNACSNTDLRVTERE